MNSYNTEFPRFALDVVIPEGFTDASWHNDTMPSWVNEDIGLKLWIDYKKEEDRETEGLCRYALFSYDMNTLSCADTSLVESDNYQDIIQQIRMCETMKTVTNQSMKTSTTLYHRSITGNIPDVMKFKVTSDKHYHEPQTMEVGSTFFKNNYTALEVGKIMMLNVGEVITLDEGHHTIKRVK